MRIIEGNPKEIAAYELALKDGAKIRDPLILDRSTNPPTWQHRGFQKDSHLRG